MIREFSFAPIRQGEKLIDGLRAGVAPAAFCSGSHYQIAVFTKPSGAYCRPRRLRNEDLLLLVGNRKDHFSATYVCFNGSGTGLSTINFTPTVLLR